MDLHAVEPNSLFSIVFTDLQNGHSIVGRARRSDTSSAIPPAELEVPVGGAIP
jgi:hypothetical protein